MLTARDHLAAVAFQERLWAIGGRSSFLGTQHASIELYDPAADRWATKKTMPELKHHVGIAAVGDKIYLMGGFLYPEEGEPAWVPTASAWDWRDAPPNGVCDAACRRNW